MKRSGNRVFWAGIAACLLGALPSGCGDNASSPKHPGGQPEQARNRQTAQSQEHYLHLGDSIATEAQKTLMSNVVAAIQVGGIAGAVGFCSEGALPLTDSLSGHFEVAIRRLSDRNRNPGNAIRSVTDSLAWQRIQALMADTLHPQKHLALRSDNGGTYYYKAITIAMPACLKCHGSPGGDIDPETLAGIRSTYPDDKAVGYRMGELRGMWKIRMDDLP